MENVLDHIEVEDFAESVRGVTRRAAAQQCILVPPSPTHKRTLFFFVYCFLGDFSESVVSRCAAVVVVCLHGRALRGRPERLCGL